MLNFIPQMIAVLARTLYDRKMCLRFAIAAGLTLSLPLLFMGYTAPGNRLLQQWMNISDLQLPAVARYLRWLAPLIVINAVRHYFTGILVLAERTRAITRLNVLHLILLVTVLMTGLRRDWGAMPTLALATMLANIAHFLWGFYLARQVKTMPAMRQTTSDEKVTWHVMFHFFWPMAVTSLLFALSRPVLYSYVNLTATAAVTVAALRVGFDFCSMFQNPINQFRHLYATFGAEDPRGVKHFMFKVTAFYLSLMAIVAFTPLSKLFFGKVMGLSAEIYRETIPAVRVMLGIPLLIMIRNLYHGRMMVRRRTGGMPMAAGIRVAVVALAAKTLLHLGLLNAMSSGIIIILGFVAEMLLARYINLRGERCQPVAA